MDEEWLWRDEERRLRTSGWDYEGMKSAERRQDADSIVARNEETGDKFMGEE